jgi:zinc protease
MTKLVAVALALAGCSRTLPTYELKLPERHAQLANGMHVILLPDPTTELVEVDVRYAVGSAEDPEGKAGLAHLVEHLMFEQRQAGPDQPPFATALRAHSLVYNAGTDWDSTHYRTTAKKDELDTLLALEALRLGTGCETIDEKTFLREREVVRNEIRQRTGTADGQLLAEILRAAYPPGHPYRRMIGGDDQELTNIQLADACKFMRDYYTPSRATVIIAGAIDETAAGRAVKRHLEPLEKREPAPLAAVPALTLQKRTIEIRADVEQPAAIAVFALPPRFTEEDSAFGFIAGSLAGWTSQWGTIYDFMTDIGIERLGGERAPILALQVDLRDVGKTDEAVDFILKSARLAHRGIEEGEGFRRFKLVRTGELALELEGLAERTAAFGDYAQFDPEQKYFAGELDRVQKMDGNHVREVVERVLDPDKALIIVVKPTKGAGLYRRAGAAAGGGEDEAEELPVDRAEAAAPIAVPEQTTPIVRARHFQLDNGLRVVLLPIEEPMPVVTASLLFSVGSTADPADEIGLARVAAQNLRPPASDQRGEGTSANGFAEFGILEQGIADEDFTIFAVRGLSLYQDILLEGLERMVSGGIYGAGLAETTQRRARLMRLKSARTRAIAERRLEEALLGAAHPYAHTVATAETVERIDGDAARSFALQHYTAANATLIVAGRFDAASAESTIRDHFGGWSRGQADRPATVPAAPRAGPVYVGVDGPPDPLVQVRIAYPAPPGHDASHAARLVLAEMLTRRVAAVREKLGASYGVYARYVPRVGPGMYLIAGGLDAERAPEALAEIRGAVDGLRRADGFLEDFVRARRRVLERLLAHADDSASLATELVQNAELGLPPEAADQLRRDVGALGPRDVIKLVNTELAPDGEVIIGVGPHKDLERMFGGAGLRAVRYEAAN